MAPRKNPLELDGGGFEPGRKPSATDYVAQLSAPKDDERGQSCFAGEEYGTYAGDTKPLIIDVNPR